jgi:hypothetical protein
MIMPTGVGTLGPVTIPSVTTPHCSDDREGVGVGGPSPLRSAGTRNLEIA